MKFLASITVAGFLSALAVAASPQASRQRLYWPKVSLDAKNGERIESVELNISCARVRGVLNIPDDWTVEVVSPSSAVTTVRASAGHGTTTLWNLSELDGSLVLEGAEQSCFDIAAVITTTTDGRQIQLKRAG